LALLSIQDVSLGCSGASTAYRATSDGYEVRRLQQIGRCPPLQQGYVTRLIARDGSVMITSQEVLATSDCPISGRRPEGLSFPERDTRARSALAAYFARAAALEAASIPAFETLEKELRALHAPEPLLAAVRAAITDERDHTERMRQLAYRFGAAPDEPQIEARPLRDGFALALDNVVEGCVRESFGALLATFQAAHASDAEIRETFARIARDETRHAALAFQIHAWLAPRLTRAQRKAVEEARDAALRSLLEERAQAAGIGLVELAGMPRDAQSEVLLTQMQGLWPARTVASAWRPRRATAFMALNYLAVNIEGADPARVSCAL
jgi:hypothetical protein